MKHDIHKKRRDDGVGESAEPQAEHVDIGAEATEEPSDVSEAKAPSPEAEPVVDYKDRWLRTEAELQTFRRRARREVEDVRRAAEESVLLELIAWLDDLERAVEAANEGGASPSWAAGVSLVLQKGRETLERLGVVAVDPVQQPFDPNFHEAILEIDAPPGSTPGSVVQVIHKGYRRGARALRPARVVVARGSSDGA